MRLLAPLFPLVVYPPFDPLVAAGGGALPYELFRPNVFKPELKEELKLELLVLGPLFTIAK